MNRKTITIFLTIICSMLILILLLFKTLDNKDTNTQDVVINDETKFREEVVSKLDQIELNEYTQVSERIVEETTETTIKNVEVGLMNNEPTYTIGVHTPDLTKYTYENLKVVDPKDYDFIMSKNNIVSNLLVPQGISPDTKDINVSVVLLEGHPHLFYEVKYFDRGKEITKLVNAVNGLVLND